MFIVTINRVQGSGFAQVANAALRDKRLSFKARGVLAMVLSYTGEWDANRDWLEGMSDHDGRDAIQSALKELNDLGYRVVVKAQKSDGTWFTEVHWMQQPKDGLSGSRETRPRVEPVVGEPVLLPEHHLQNTDYLPSSPAAPPASQRAMEFSSMAADPKPEAAPRRKAKHALPDDYQPDPQLVKWTEANAPGIDVRVEWANFCDDALAKDKRMVDWRRAWMTWARNAEKWSKPRRTTQRVVSQEDPLLAWTPPTTPIDYKAEYDKLVANDHPLEGDPDDA